MVKVSFGVLLSLASIVVQGDEQGADCYGRHVHEKKPRTPTRSRSGNTLSPRTRGVTALGWISRYTRIAYIPLPSSRASEKHLFRTRPEDRLRSKV